MTARALLAAAALVAVSFSTAPRVARACTAPVSCAGAGVAVAPANANAIVFRGVRAPGFEWSATEPAISLQTAAGVAVPFALSKDPAIPGHWVLRTDPLVAGDTYRVKWDALCSPAHDDTADGAEVSVVVPASAPAPASIGTIELTGPWKTTHAASSCDPPALAKSFAEVGVTVSVDPDPALAPYADVTAWQILVDGVQVGDRGYPAFESTTGYGHRLPTSPRTLSASCDPGVDTGIAPGKHVVTVRAVIAGLDTPLAAEVAIDLDCATTKGLDAGGASASSGPSSPDGAGCLYARAGRAGSSTAAIVLLAATAVGARGRRRGRLHTSSRSPRDPLHTR